MHHFLFEFITGGGLAGQPLPDSLAHEGDMMLQALLNDLMEAGQTNISITRDKRLTPLTRNVTQYIVDKNLDDRLSDIIKQDDVVWLIAPETEACLANYADFFIQRQCQFIGSTPEAISVVSSKLQTYQLLKKMNIETIETCTFKQSIPVAEKGWIIKPDDGAGAEGCCYFYDKADLNDYLSGCDPDKYIIQPFIPGEHMSMSLLVYEQDVVLLGCNRQYIEFEDEKVSVVAIGVNELIELYEPLLLIAKRVASSIKGLVGYIGVDLVMQDERIFVVEINPRLTTAYAGLSESLGINVAELILNTFLSGKLVDIDVSATRSVRIDL